MSAPYYPDIPFNNEFTDVIMKTNDGKTIPFWKLILCQHEFYKNMFAYSFKEKDEKEINIDCSFEAGQMILSVLFQMYRNLPYDMYIFNSIVFDMYIFADQHCIDELKIACLRFIRNMPYSGELLRFVRLYSPSHKTFLTVNQNYDTLWLADKYMECYDSDRRNFTRDDVDFELLTEVVKKAKNIYRLWIGVLVQPCVSDEEAKALQQFIPKICCMGIDKLFTLLGNSEDFDRKKIDISQFLFRRLNAKPKPVEYERKTGYQLWCDANRDTFKAEIPYFGQVITSEQVSNKLSYTWDVLTINQKNMWEEKASALHLQKMDSYMHDI